MLIYEAIRKVGQASDCQPDTEASPRPEPDLAFLTAAAKKTSSWHVSFNESPHSKASGKEHPEE